MVLFLVGVMAEQRARLLLFVSALTSLYTAASLADKGKSYVFKMIFFPSHAGIVCLSDLFLLKSFLRLLKKVCPGQGYSTAMFFRVQRRRHLVAFSL